MGTALSVHPCTGAQNRHSVTPLSDCAQILERPDDAVEFMREVLRKSSAEMEAGGAEGDQEAEWAEAGAAAAGGGGDRAQTPGKRAVGTLRVHAEFTDARGAVTQMHLFRVSFPSSTEP